MLVLRSKHTTITDYVDAVQVYEKDLLNARFINRRTKQEHTASWTMIAQYVLRDNVLLAGVFFFATVMACAIT